MDVPVKDGVPGAAAMAIAVLVMMPCALHAQSWPVRPIRYIVPFPPGGGTDVSARALGSSISAALGQQVVIENRSGAGGLIGSEVAAKSPPDGYTLLQATVAQVSIAPHLGLKLAFDPPKDLAPVTLTGDIFNVLVVHPALPVRSVADLVALAKKRPGSLNFASSGVGVPDHLAGELFQIVTGTKMVHVPYKGGPLAMVDLVSGNVQLMFSTVASGIGMVRAQKLRPLAITNSLRFSGLPDLPTIAQAGLPGCEVNNWTGVFVPAATPRAIVTRLNGVLVKAAAVPETKSLLLQSGIGARTNTPEQFAQFVQAESAKWQKVIRDAKVTAR